ncbi:TBC domain-containing protein [Purpureocillium lavendulum]|uniref:TBC domain-containing protein n=1 Tax=Purpureocillium lavendulum TaxID=1247861 RepID=A0AB34G792_9HYPO|nr:TBC domain-containing protein [Purpureocillium lavendulum]
MRTNYSDRRTHLLKYIEHPEALAEVSVDPLADDPDSPWNTVRQDEIIRAEIRQDVQRLPDEADYHQDKVQSMILDILFVYCKVNPDRGGYRQGMHELLAPIVHVVQQDAVNRAAISPGSADEEMLDALDDSFVEHDAYVLFSRLMDRAQVFYEVKDAAQSATSTQNGLGYQEQRSAIVERSKHIHEVCLQKIDEELASHLKNVEILPQIFLIFIQQQGGVESLFQGAAKSAKGVLERGEKLGINQAVRDAMVEIRRNMQSFNESRQPQHTPRQVLSEHGAAKALTAMERRNKQLANLLNDAVTDLKAMSLSKQENNDKSQELLEVVAAKIQFVQVYLEDPSMEVPSFSAAAGKEPDSQEGDHGASPQATGTERQNEPGHAESLLGPPTVATVSDMEAAKDPTGQSNQNVASGSSPREDPLGGDAGASTKLGPPLRPAAIPTRSTLAQSSFSWMLEPDESSPTRSLPAAGMSPQLQHKKRSSNSASRERNAFLFGEANAEPESNECHQESDGGKEECRDECAQSGNLIAAADLLGNPRRQIPDIVNVLTNVLLNPARLVTIGQAGCQLGAQYLLEDRRANGDADAGAEGAEQIGAGNDDCRVLGRGIGEEADEGGGAQHQRGHLANGGFIPKRDGEGEDAKQLHAVATDGDGIELARPLDEPAATDRCQHTGDHGRHEERAADGGAVRLHGLEVQRQEEQEAELAGHAEEVGEVAGDEAPVEDDVAGGEGVRRELDLHQDEEDEEDGGGAEGDDGDEVRPAEVGSGVEAGEQGDDGEDEGKGAEEVDLADLVEPVGLVWARNVEDEVDGQPGDYAERRLSEEGPIRRFTELDHVAGEAAADAAGGEDGIGEEEALLAAKDVAELAVQRLEAGEGEEVPGWDGGPCERAAGASDLILASGEGGRGGDGSRGGDPADVVEGVELVPNLGVGGYGEELVDGDEEELTTPVSPEEVHLLGHGRIPVAGGRIFGRAIGATAGLDAAFAFTIDGSTIAVEIWPAMVMVVVTEQRGRLGGGGDGGHGQGVRGGPDGGG